MTEQETIARARSGDRNAFAQLVELYGPAIYNLCYRMLGQAADAEDATQEAFLRAYSQLRRYDAARSFKTWLFSIASHYCIDRLRRRRIIWLDIDGEPLLSHPALRERRQLPEDEAVRSEESAAIQRLLGQLQPLDRGAIIMRYWYGMSYDEIAVTMGTSVSAIKSRLHRARLTLGAMIQGTAQARPRVAPAFALPRSALHPTPAARSPLAMGA